MLMTTKETSPCARASSTIPCAQGCNSRLCGHTQNLPDGFILGGLDDVRLPRNPAQMCHLRRGKDEQKPSSAAAPAGVCPRVPILSLLMLGGEQETLDEGFFSAPPPASIPVRLLGVICGQGGANSSTAHEPWEQRYRGSRDGTCTAPPVQRERSPRCTICFLTALLRSELEH